MHVRYLVGIIVIISLFLFSFYNPKITGYFIDLGNGECECNSCGDCIDALNSPNCNIVYLTADILDNSGKCIDNPENFTNKIFDCQGHVIDGTGNWEGIYLIGKHNNTIKNCIIKEFNTQIYLENSDNNTLDNNTLNASLQMSYPIYFYQCSNNFIINNSCYGGEITIMCEYGNCQGNNNSFINNTFMGSDSKSLYFWNYLSESNKFLNNNFLNAVFENSYGSGNLIKDNKFYYTSDIEKNYYIISEYESANDSIENNIIYSEGTWKGIIIGADNNRIINNTINCSCCIGGISVENSKNNIISNNKIHNIKYECGFWAWNINTGGISFEDNSYNNTVKNNIIWDISYEESPYSADGISILDSEYNYFENNTIFNTLDNGIAIYSGSHNIFKNNFVYNVTSKFYDGEYPTYTNAYTVYGSYSINNTFINETIAGETPETYPVVIDFEVLSGDIGINAINEAPNDPLEFKNISIYLNITKITENPAELNITFHYKNENLNGISENSLFPSKYTNNKWKLNIFEFLNKYNLDKDNNIINLDIIDFGSIFAPLGIIPEGNECECNSCGNCIDALNNPSCNIVYLTSDILDNSGTCIDNPENFNNKVFDCQGHVIDGSGSGYGIRINGKSDFTIIKCAIKDFETGLYLDSSSNANVYINNIYNNNRGIFASSSNINLFYNILQNNTEYNLNSIQNSNISVHELNIDSNVIYGELRDLKIGSIYSIPSIPRDLRYVKFINITNTSANSFLFLNLSYNDIDLSIDANESSLSFWKFNNSGWFSCSEFANNCGIDIENNYVYMNTTSFGDLFGVLGELNICECSYCEDCIEKINNESCGNIKLTSDILEHPRTCIYNPENFNNKVFDCQGHVISGFNNIEYGFFIFGKQNNTIKNCIISNFDTGIYLYSNNSLLINLTFYNNSYSGISFYNSLYNNLTNIVVYGSTGGSGIYIYYLSDNNTLTNITASENFNGIQIEKSNYNSLFNINSSKNYYGFLISDSMNNLISNATVSENEEMDINIYFFEKNEEACNNIFENIKSYENREFLYVNSPSNIQNKVLAELILCNASGSNITNVTIIGSETLNNNGLFVYYTNDSKFENINSSENYYGVYLYFSSNNTLKDIIANSNYNGIYLESSSNNILTNNNASSNEYTGIYLESSSNNILSNIMANKNFYGIETIFSSNNNLIENITATENSRGIDIGGSSENNILYFNSFCYNYYKDIYNEIPSTYGDNNKCILTFQYNDDGSSGCDNICEVNSNGCNCTSCGECNYELSHPLCSEVDLINNITQEFRCIDNPENFNNKVFDCKGNIITGMAISLGGEFHDNGILLTDKQNNTIKNCIIKNFTYGIELISCFNISVINNTLKNNTEWGANLDFSNNINFVNNTICYNTKGLFNIIGTNIIDNNTFCADFINPPSSWILSFSNISVNVSNILFSPASCYFRVNNTLISINDSVSDFQETRFEFSEISSEGIYNINVYCNDTTGTNYANNSIQIVIGDLSVQDILIEPQEIYTDTQITVKAKIYSTTQSSPKLKL
ncbi:MAG: right-handed parallel beta-helix repeat-containing protein, partial [Candidatus Aenigmarchaeota archaeon]|nr:right-handed parallel beta-helix repeat-containing protein [Candidatus Aenigmarchaeota archaeon]